MWFSITYSTHLIQNRFLKHKKRGSDSKVTPLKTFRDRVRLKNNTEKSMMNFSTDPVSMTKQLIFNNNNGTDINRSTCELHYH